MRLNIFQKVIVIIYSTLFLYFCLFHVPFKTSEPSSIIYDTLFSNKAEIHISRLIIILFIITIISTGLFLLTKNLKYVFRLPTHREKKVITYLILVLSTLVFIFWGLSPFFNKNKPYTNKENTNKIDLNIDQVAVDSAAPVVSKNDVEYLEKKAATCNEDQVKRDFQSYMKFNYPDWKIYGDPIIQLFSDCTYRVQFTTMNPRLRYKKEIIIIEIAYTSDLEHYNFNTIRGILY